MKKIFKILGVGEILWDVFPNSKKLGGAPTNFAYHVCALGHEGIIVSRIGNDDYGREIIKQLINLGLITDYVQIDSERETGIVEVRIDEKNQPHYIIKEDVAWDFIQWDSKFDSLLETADAICFGTLAQRSKVSRNTILNLLEKINKNALKVYDINLRQSFYSKNIIIDALKLSDILKLNSEEIEIIRELLNINTKYDEKEICKFLINSFDLDLICLTKGEDGSILISEQSSYHSPSYPYKVADRVGAGDAFTAAVIVNYLKSEPIDAISVKANKLASWVTSKNGGTPVYDFEIKEIMNL
ncbi:MAG: carbohydrate kinase [Actinobacteria bacterium]|nr:carbohydrate kinase [Cyanobacteriota bacterium]MCL6087265.1 carbohydrate kinase [Actinomycetota bacterium]